MAVGMCDVVKKIRRQQKHKIINNEKAQSFA